MADFLIYWKRETVEDSLPPLLNHAAGDQLHRVSPGDTLWVTASWTGDLHLIGRITVDRVVGQRVAERRLRVGKLWTAKYHVIAESGTEMPPCRISLANVVSELRFTGRSDRLKVRDRRVDGKQLQTMRQLDGSSAALLAQVLDPYAQVDSTPKGDGVVETVDRITGRRQGFSVSPKVRMALERWSMEKAVAHYTAHGFEVEDVHLHQPVDLICRKGNQILHVEVKGTQTSGEEVLLTPGEVEFARLHRGGMALFVVHSVVVVETGPGEPMISGGITDVRGWLIDDSRLLPVGYRYSLRG